MRPLGAGRPGPRDAVVAVVQRDAHRLESDGVARDILREPRHLRRRQGLGTLERAQRGSDEEQEA